jgi:hypothetical protein
VRLFCHLAVVQRLDSEHFLSCPPELSLILVSLAIKEMAENALRPKGSSSFVDYPSDIQLSSAVPTASIKLLFNFDAPY